MSKRDEDIARRRHNEYLRLLPKDKQIELYANHFVDITSDRYILANPSGFLGMGILKEPSDHISEGVNTLSLFGVGLGETPDTSVHPIREVISLDMTRDEAEGYLEVLQEGVKLAEKHNIKRTNEEIAKIEWELKK